MKQFIFISLFLISSIHSFAQSKKENVKTLIGLMKAEESIDKVFESIIPMIKNQAGGELKEDKNRDEFMEYVMKEAKAMSLSLINNDMVELYDKYFTDDEIKDYIKFYKSKSGKKMIEAFPNIQTDLMNNMMVKYMPDYQNKLKLKMEELKNK